MKFEYKEKVMSHLESIDKRTVILQEMLEGKTPADQKKAIVLSKEIQRLVELTTNIVDIS